MTREEIKNKLFDIILKNSSPTIEIKRTIDYQQTMAIVEELIAYESDLLKEFVGYWHRHWGNNWGIYNYAVNDSVDIALEQFIKEQKNETDNHY